MIANNMFSEKIEQLITILEKQEIDVSNFLVCVKNKYNESSFLLLGTKWHCIGPVVF